MPKDDSVQRAWENGNTVPGHDPDKMRKDECGAWIVRTEYHNHESGFGWELDHSNLRPVQWENQANGRTGHLICVVTSDGGANVRKEQDDE